MHQWPLEMHQWALGMHHRPLEIVIQDKNALGIEEPEELDYVWFGRDGFRRWDGCISISCLLLITATRHKTKGSGDRGT